MCITLELSFGGPRIHNRSGGEFISLGPVGKHWLRNNGDRYCSMYPIENFQLASPVKAERNAIVKSFH